MINTKKLFQKYIKIFLLVNLHKMKSKFRRVVYKEAREFLQNIVKKELKKF